MRTNFRRILSFICSLVIIYCWIGTLWHVGKGYFEHLSGQQHQVNTVDATSVSSSVITHLVSKPVAPRDTVVDQSTASFTSVPTETKTTDSATRHHCNQPQSFTINEGQPIGELALRHVTMIFRHGIRTPFGNGVAELGVKEADCSMTSLAQQSAAILNFLRALRNVTSSTVSSPTWKNLIDRFGTHPNSDRCGRSQLTSAGANQLLELGQRLRSAYDKNDEFREQYKGHIARELVLYVTMYSRTVQSAVAFLSGFLQTDFNEAVLDALQVHATSNIYFCGSAFEDTLCHCPLVHKQSKGRTKGVVPDAHVSRRQQVNANLTLHLLAYGARRIPHVREVVDAVMPTLCQGQGQATQCPPPVLDSAPAADPLIMNESPNKIQGRGQTCFPRQMVDGMWQMLDDDKEREMANEDERHRQRLLAYPLLREVSQRLLDIQLHRKSAPSFSIYHGHDQTITSLLVALGIRDSRWPPFASRLTVEAYTPKKTTSSDVIVGGRLGDGLLMRVLYDGRDMTSALPWCHRVTVDGRTVCSLDSFHTHLTNHASGYFLTGQYVTDCDLDLN